VIPDQADRDAARRTLDRNIVVEAGAGTGKTTLLTDRILFLLAGGGPRGEGLDITRIVALTFTEKAAGEIKTRLAQRLTDLAAFLDGRDLPTARRRWVEGWLDEVRRTTSRTDDELRSLAERAFQNLDRASLGTIHTFAAQLLRLHPLEAGVDPGFVIDKGDWAAELFEAEWSLWLDQELGVDAPRRALWREILPRAGLGDLADLARALCREEAEDCRFGTPEAPGLLRRLATDAARLPDGKPPVKRGKFLERLGEIVRRLERLADALEDPEAHRDAPEEAPFEDRKSTRLNSSHIPASRMPSSA
jgi:ATP-dependent helicase/nuclease subunit A